MSETRPSGAFSQRYSRHLSLPGFGVAAQESLGAARVLVVGAGGLGSPVLAYLAASGVGRLGIVDDDVVERSNLQRQVIHRDRSVGVSKVDSAALFVGDLNPDVEVVTHTVRLDARTALEILPEYDVVVDGTDNFEARYVLNDVCVLLGIPLVWASISEYEGQLGVVVAGRGPCYRCLFPTPPAPGEVLSCAEGGVLSVVPGVLGTLQAAEVIKVLTSVGSPVDGGVLLYDALAARSIILDLSRDPDCLACSGDPEDIGPGAGPSLQMGLGCDRAVRDVSLAELPPQVLMIDVREPSEVAERAWPGALIRPMSGWSSGNVVEVAAEIMQQLERLAPTAGYGEAMIVTLCASGSRSKHAASLLIEAGVPSGKVASLRGGLSAVPLMSNETQ